MQQYRQSGFRGPNNWYRNLLYNNAITPELEHARFTQPAAFAAGSEDDVLLYDPNWREAFPKAFDDLRFIDWNIYARLERLLLKGDIVVKKAYCDWERYREFKKPMHEAAFELIEIPHVRMSGKNSADIRMVVDALDLCYTKSHVDTFVIISGDSDFSPLVSKLRENNKIVIGVGVKQSSSDLLISNCDEFIFYEIGRAHV